MLSGARKADTLKSAAIVAAVLAMIACASVLKVPAQSRALSLADILIALRSKKAEPAEKNKILSDAVKQRGITFALTPEIEKELDSTGAAGDLIAAIREKAPPPPTAAPMKEPQPAPKPVEDFNFFRTRATEEMASDAAAALVDLDKAIALKADDPGVHHDKAMLLSSKGSLDEAVVEYTKASELAPKDPRNFSGRAAAYEKLGKQVEALGDYQKVLALAPADQGAAASVVRISSSLTRAAMEATAKQPVTTPVEKSSAAAPQFEKASIASNAPVPGTRTTKPEATPAKVVPETDASTAAASPVEMGNLTAYCKDLVKPVYPQTALLTRVGGDVNVTLMLADDGKVIDAKATSGAASLRTAAENAARRSKFTPVLKDGKPVRATGFLIYKFSLGDQ